MGWLYHRNYVGPDRRAGRFEFRFRERRERQPAPQSRAALKDLVGELIMQGRKWVDAFSYYGPDRRSGVFSHFLLDRRREDASGPPPALSAALRQLRVRGFDADREEGRQALCERLRATALLADAQGRAPVGDLLLHLATTIEAESTCCPDILQQQLHTAEAMLDDAQLTPPA